MSDIPGTPADGHVKIVTLDAVADPDNITLAELNDADTLDVSCYLTADGWNPGLDQSTATDDRLCDTVTYENIGRSQRSLGIRYVENPAASVGTTNEAYERFTPGSTGWFVVRRGFLYTAAWAANQPYQAWPWAMGDYDWQPPEANTVLHVAQKPFVTGKVHVGKVHA
jgi:hypothetical protein